MELPAKMENIINISDSDSHSGSSSPSESLRHQHQKSQSEAPVVSSAPGNRGISTSSRKKTFQTYPGQGLKQQRQKEGSGRYFLSDEEMMGELHFCLRQLHCLEDKAGFRLRQEVFLEMEQLVSVWVREEAARLGAAKGAQARLVSFGSSKLGVIDCESDLDLLCVVPGHVTRNSFFTSLYHRLQNKVSNQG